MGIDCMGTGGNGGVKIHPRSSILQTDTCAHNVFYSPQFLVATKFRRLTRRPFLDSFFLRLFFLLAQSSAVIRCLCLSKVGVLWKRLDGSVWFLAGGLPAACPTLHFKEIGISPKLMVLSSRTLSQSLNLETAHAFNLIHKCNEP